MIATTILAIATALIPSGNTEGPRKIIKEEILAQIPEEHFFPATSIYEFLESYSDEELSRIILDYSMLYDTLFHDVDKCPIYLFTAGGPGAGKSTILENYLSQNEIHFAYIDPDRTCLQKMMATYLSDIAAGMTSEEAYTKWREASNFISNTLMAIALKEGLAIAHGTTMSTTHAAKVLKAIKKDYGYERHCLHITAPDEVRIAADRLRQDTIYQCAEEDLIEKGKMFAKRYNDYMENTEKLLFFFRPSLDQTVFAAIKINGELNIWDEEAWEGVLRVSQVPQSSS